MERWFEHPTKTSAPAPDCPVHNLLIKDDSYLQHQNALLLDAPPGRRLARSRLLPVSAYHKRHLRITGALRRGCRDSPLWFTRVDGACTETTRRPPPYRLEVLEVAGSVPLIPGSPLRPPAAPSTGWDDGGTSRGGAAKESSARTLASASLRIRAIIALSSAPLIDPRKTGREATWVACVV